MRAHLCLCAASLAASSVACGGGEPDGSGGSPATSSGATTHPVGSSSAVTTASTGSMTTGNGGGGPPYPAPHPAPPQVQNLGGPVLASPRFVPVFFAGDDASIMADVTDFLGKVGGSKYWAAATSEYGVGPGTATAAVQLTEAAPGEIDDDGIQLWLAGKLDGDDPAWPAADANTLYVLHYPAGVTITYPAGGQTEESCVSFGGYHDSITLDGAHALLSVAYAVVPRCSDFDGYTGIDAVTSAESHELIEASTDPFPATNPAYAEVDDDHLYWQSYLQGTEVGDLCAFTPTSFTDATDVPYLVQRTWSNAAALASHDPCVPAPAGEVYFDAAPVEKTSVAVAIGGFAFSSLGVQIPVGGTKTIDVDLFSDGDTGGPWSVVAQGVDPQPYLDVGLDSCGGQNGDTLHLTISVNAASPQGFEVFQLLSSNGGQQSYWLGIVTQ